MCAATTGDEDDVPMEEAAASSGVPYDYVPNRSDDEIQSLVLQERKRVQRIIYTQLKEKMKDKDHGEILQKLHEQLELWDQEGAGDLEARLRGEPVFSTEETREQLAYSQHTDLKRSLLNTWAEISKDGKLMTAEEILRARPADASNLQEAAEVRQAGIDLLLRNTQTVTQFREPTREQLKEWGRRYFDGNERFFLDLYKPVRKVYGNEVLEDKEAYDARCRNLAAVDQQLWQEIRETLHELGVDTPLDPQLVPQADAEADAEEAAAAERSRVVQALDPALLAALADPDAPAPAPPAPPEVCPPPQLPRGPKQLHAGRPVESAERDAASTQLAENVIGVPLAASAAAYYAQQNYREGEYARFREPSDDEGESDGDSSDS